MPAVAANPRPMPDLLPRFARARFRAWHRGTREADLMIGGFFDKHHARWSQAELAWFEALLDEDETDVMAWALCRAAAPERFAGPLLEALQRLDYVTI
jgi:antitoxin CptB